MQCQMSILIDFQCLCLDNFIFTNFSLSITAQILTVSITHYSPHYTLTTNKLNTI